MRIYKQKDLEPRQRQLLYGSLLGDASISRIAEKNGNCRVAFVQGQKQWEYLLWKYEEMRDWVLTPPHLVHPTSFGGQVAAFSTMRHPVFTEIYREVYPEGKKRASLSFLSKLDAFSLAVWYQDDGSWSKNCLSLHTQSFPLQDCLLLQQLLLGFGVESKINNAKGWVIQINKRESREAFLEMVRPYVLPSLAYKIGGSRLSPQLKMALPVQPLKCCKICGTSFPPYKSKVVCSPSCRAILLAKLQKEARAEGRCLHRWVYGTCPVCGKGFKSRHPEKKTCSHKCGALWWRGSTISQIDIPRNCILCGQVFHSADKRQKKCPKGCQPEAPDTSIV